jgi:hypothetical protein
LLVTLVHPYGYQLAASVNPFCSFGAPGVSFLLLSNLWFRFARSPSGSYFRTGWLCLFSL